MDQESETPVTKDIELFQEESVAENTETCIEKSTIEDSSKTWKDGDKESPESSSVDVDKDSISMIQDAYRSATKIPEIEATESSSISDKNKSPEDTTSGVTCKEIGNLSSHAEKSETSIRTETHISTESCEAMDSQRETGEESNGETAVEKAEQEETENLPSVEEANTLPSVEEAENVPPVEEAETSQSVEDVETLSPLDETETLRPTEEAETLPPVEDIETLSPLDEAETLRPTEEAETLPPEEEAETLLPVEEAETLLPVEEAETLPPVEEAQQSKEMHPDSENSVDVPDSIVTISKKSTEDSQLETEFTSADADVQQKEATEKQIVEPENTEFVQISQDKNDDTHNEGQSMDAEDPFGADNLIPDSAEPSRVVSPTDEIDFRKLGDQADNLQDVVNAKDTNFGKSGEFAAEESNPDDNSESADAEVSENTEAEPAESNTETVSNVAEESKRVSTEEKSSERSGEKSESEPMIVDSPEEVSDENKKKSEVDVLPMETDETQSNVLPGQDDELCIIPDSMKESSGLEASNKTDKTSKDSEKEKKSSDTAKEATALKEAAPVTKDFTEGVKVVDALFKEKDTIKDKESSKEKSPATTDVIDIDDELKNSEIEELPPKDICKQCKESKICNISVKIGTESFNVCSQTCKNAFTQQNNRSVDIPSDGVNSKREKRCAGCLLIVDAGDERNLSWETMEFCNEECLGKFQTKYGSYCRNCNGSVQPISLGKYCVRFGYDVRQFCCSSCLEEFKKGLKICSYCQKDISSGTEGFLAPVGDKGLFRDFCTQYCMEKYSRMNSTEPANAEKKACSVCQEEKVVHCEVQIDRATPVAICSDPCFAAFKFVNKVDPDQCSTCKKFFELATKNCFVVFYESEAHTFCNKTCLNIFIITNRKIVPCNWCKVKKYNFDMIKKELKSGQTLMMCSLNCLTLYQVSINAVSAKRISCDFCKEFSQAQYHLTMSDATIRNFCSYNCVMKFQSQYTKSPITIPTGDDPVPTGMPKRTYPPAKGLNQPIQKPTEVQSKKIMPVISSVTSLALTSNGQVPQVAQQTTINTPNVATSVATTQSQTPQVIVNQQVIARPPSPVKIHNKITQCKPLMHTKGVSVRPHPCTKATQTEGESRIVVPVPVPIYVPFPVHMWSMPFPIPVPFPLPIPVPIFIPTTRNSAKGIFKDIKRIQEKIPADPFEAELLMMAEMVATEKKANESDSDSSDDNGPESATDPVDSSNTFGEDMLQMALKMATGELDEPAVDLETALTPTTITATQAPSQTDSALNADGQPERLMPATRGKKRMVPYKPRSTPSKRGRRVSGVHDVPMMLPPESHPQSQPRMMEPIEKPDANMALKYTFGVNAWRQWVVAKNTELEKQITPTRKVKLFKTDLLQLTADELNYTLCLFVKEVRKPNGAEYAPDTIYYLCLGIQQYLFENNRIDNIFTDSYYEKFTDCLNDVAKKFSVLYNEAQYIVTRVEEEHLWECKQLGAHSPHVLLSTLMFFNTKHFNLVTVEEHMQLSFSHIMKHWKRNPAAQAAAVAGKGPGTRNVLLRFYPPQSALEANSRKKKVYEQQENEENPLRCPVKLYEFYLSKCPESVKTRNDVFYLLPERSCVPDSPVWYSTSALAKEHLVKMLYRVKMVKEINVALLTS